MVKKNNDVTTKRCSDEYFEVGNREEIKIRHDSLIKKEKNNQKLG